MLKGPIDKREFRLLVMGLQFAGDQQFADDVRDLLRRYDQYVEETRHDEANDRLREASYSLIPVDDPGTDDLHEYVNPWQAGADKALRKDWERDVIKDHEEEPPF